MAFSTGFWGDLLRHSYDSLEFDNSLRPLAVDDGNELLLESISISNTFRPVWFSREGLHHSSFMDNSINLS